LAKLGGDIMVDQINAWYAVKQRKRLDERCRGIAREWCDSPPYGVTQQVGYV